MDLDEIAVRLRSREPYEAIDLGFAVAREFLGPLYGAWIVLVVPIFAAAAAIAAGTGTLWAPLLAVWVLKPLYDRVPLFVVSRGLFGDVPDVGRTIRRAFSGSLTSALYDCTVARLSHYRGFLIPLRELEELSGSRYRSRKKAMLRTNVRAPAVLFLAVSMVFEAMVVISGYFAVFLFAPPEFRAGSSLTLDQMTATGEVSPGVAVAVLGCYFVAVSVVEIFYISGSFGLYINRRIHLEGWDIEIDFKRLSRRLRSESSGPSVLLVAGLAASVAAALVGAPTPTATQPAPLESENEPGETIERVLEDEEFGETKEEWVWERKETESSSDGSALAAFGRGAASILELLLWGAVGVAVLLFSYYVVRRAGASSGSEREETSDEPPDPEYREVEEETTFELPTDLVESAVRHWEAGEPTESLSILYRGTLRNLAAHYDVEVEPYMTARECVREVRRAGGPGTYVSKLARAWSSAAYADRPPTDDEARDLFQEWRRHFARGER